MVEHLYVPLDAEARCSNGQDLQQGRGTAVEARVARRLVRQAYQRAGRVSYIRVMDSGSMHPMLTGGCRVAIRWGVPSKGDAVGLLALLELPGGVLVVHRLCRTRKGEGEAWDTLQIPDSFRAGDPYVGSWIEADRILGSVAEVRRSTELGEQSSDDLVFTTIVARTAASLAALGNRVFWRASRSRLPKVGILGAGLLQRQLVRAAERWARRPNREK